MPPKLPPHSNSLDNYFKPSPVEKPPKRDWKKLYDNLEEALRDNEDVEKKTLSVKRSTSSRRATPNRKENREGDTESASRRTTAGSLGERHSDNGGLKRSASGLEQNGKKGIRTSGSSLSQMPDVGEDTHTQNMSGRKSPRKRAASPAPEPRSVTPLQRSASSDPRWPSSSGTKLASIGEQPVDKDTSSTTDTASATKPRKIVFKPRGSGSSSSNLSQMTTSDVVFLSERRSPKKLPALATVPEVNGNSPKNSVVMESIEPMDSIEDADRASNRPQRKRVTTPFTSAPTPISRSSSQTAGNSTHKRTGSNLVKEATKNRRKLSPSPSLAQAPRTPRRRPPSKEDIESEDMEMKDVDEVDMIQMPVRKTAVVVLPAYDPEWHASRSASPNKRMTRASSRQLESPQRMHGINSQHGTPARKVTPQKVAPSKGQKPIIGLSPAQKSRGTTPVKITERRTASGRVTRGCSAAPLSPVAPDTIRVTRSRGTTPHKQAKSSKPARASVSFTLPTLDESDEDDLPSPSALISPNSKAKGKAPAGKSSSSFLSTVPTLPSVDVRSSQRTEVPDSDAESELSSDSGRDYDPSSRKLEHTLIQNATSRSESTSFGTLSSQRARPETHKSMSGRATTSSSRLDLGGQSDGRKEERGKRYKFDLKSLVRNALQNESTEESARRVARLLDGEGNIVRTTGSPSKKRTGELLEQIVEDKFGDESAGKVLKALDVEDIRAVEKKWYFFDPRRKRQEWLERKFERSWIPERRQWEWMDLLVEKEKREACLRSGYFVDCVELTEELPHDVALWLLDGVVKEKSEPERKGYADMLLAATESLANTVTPVRVKHYFKLLGAKDDALEVQEEMRLVREVNSPHEGRTSGNDWSELKDFISFLGQAAEDLAFETCEYILGVLLRLCADSLIRMHLSLFAVVQTAVVNLSEMFDDEDEDGPKWEEVSIRLTTNLYDTVVSPAMLSSILHTLPSTPRIHIFRRRLAYAYFRRSRSLLSQPIDESFHIWQLTATLESARFNVSRLSDFAALHADIELLNIALDAGISKSSPRLYGARALSLSASTSRDSDTDVAMGNLILTPGEKKQEEAFNNDVDALAENLKKVWGQIYVDLSDIERKYAKVAIECVRRRLLCTVRTKMVPRLKVFDREGDDEGQVELKKSFMKRFLTGEREVILGTDRQEDSREDGDNDVEMKD